MSTYYEYREVGVMIAHRLMAMDGWKVYGYHADESDSMTDYYSPAYWNGVAEKNGYILCVNVYGASKEQEITRYNKNYVAMDSKTKETIKKLEAMTQEHGASEQEEETAKAKIELLKNKANENNANVSQYEVIGTIPAHMAHPPKCNWHIEKDGVIIEKGNGILKYSSIDNYYSYDSYMEDMKEFKTMSKEKYLEKYMNDTSYNHYSDEEKERKQAESHYNNMVEYKKLMDQFEAFINKIDTTCGGILGSGDLVTYEKVIKTEYKTENKAIETTTGSVKEGQCFILKSNFNYGCFKGLVYRIHESVYEGKTYYHAYKLNGKLTKECTGMASQNNSWNTFGEKFDKWITNGSIAYCDITEVKTPYEVEKVVKNVIKSETENTVEQQQTKEKKATSKTEQTETTDINTLHYDIKEDIDTRDNSKLFVVKVVEKLDRDEYVKVNNNMKSLGGYYSKFKHGFIFKNDPTNLLNNDIKHDTQTENNAKAQDAAETIKDYSTEAMEELGLKYPDYINNTDYITRLSEKISNIKLDDNIINCIEYEGLKQTLKTILQNRTQEQKTETKQAEGKPIDFEIEQKDKIWLVKIKDNLPKEKFAEVKRNFATIKGFYSGLYSSFIFKYDPTEKIKSA